MSDSDEMSDGDRAFTRQDMSRRGQKSNRNVRKDIGIKMDLIQSKIDLVKTEIQRKAPQGTTLGVLEFKKRGLEEDLKRLYRKERGLEEVPLVREIPRGFRENKKKRNSCTSNCLEKMKVKKNPEGKEE